MKYDWVMKKGVLVVVAGVAMVLGIAGSRFLFVGSAMSLVPWGLVGLATGIYAKSRKEALINGAVYGFVLAFVFMLSRYQGADPVWTKILPFAMLGIAGTVCGVVLGIGGFHLKIVKIKRGQTNSQGEASFSRSA